MGEEVRDAERTDGEISDDALRSALDLAVTVAAVGARLRPPLAYPLAIRPFLRFQKLPAAALHAVRVAVEGDPEFRERIGKVASSDLIDEVGILWLTRPEGWVSAIGTLLRETPDEACDAAAGLRAERRRREAAEKALVRARTELASVREELDRERVSGRALADQLAGALTETSKARTNLAELAASLRKSEARAERAERAAATASAAAQLGNDRVAQAEAARDAALTAAGEPVVAAPSAVSLDVSRVRTLLQRAAQDSEELARLVGQASNEFDIAVSPSPQGGRAQQRPAKHRAGPKRTPLKVPGGLLADSDAVAEHFLKATGVRVLLDGYNVAKLGWPALDLAHQRHECIAAAERIARRWGTDVTVVFDGADVVGASTAARRLVRVVFSPAGVLADDVLRAEVEHTVHTTPVLVVTNDQEVLADVRACGANTISSERFLAIARR